MGYTKRNKRCIPKEGMPHAHKACQKRKKEKRCIPKEGMPQTHKVCQKKENIAHTKKTLQGKENSYKGVLIHHPPKISTHTSWSRLMTCFSFGSGLGEEWNTLSDPRDHPRNLQISFQKLYKTSGLTVEQRSGKWYSTSRSDPQPPKMKMIL